MIKFLAHMRIGSFPSVLIRRHVVSSSIRRFFAAPKQPRGGGGAPSRSQTDVPLKKFIGLPSKAELTKIIRLLRPERGRIGLAIGLLVISSAVTISVPFGLGKFIDVIFNERSDTVDFPDKLRQFALILVFVFAIGATANAGRIFLLSTAGSRIVHDHDKLHLLLNYKNDTTVVGDALTQNISDGLRAVFATTGSVAMMLYLSPQLSSIGLLVVPPLSVLGVVYGRYVRKISAKTQDSLAVATSHAEECLSSMPVVRAFAAEVKEDMRQSSKLDHALDLMFKQAQARAAFFGTAGFTGNCVALGVFYQGGLLTTSSDLTVGALSAFLLYAVTAGTSLTGLAGFYSEMMRGIGASARLWKLDEYHNSIDSSAAQSPELAGRVAGELLFKDVHFSYPLRLEDAVLSEFSAVVRPGERVAFVGPSGVGKSTLALLLLRFYDPSAGSIFLDGQDLRTVDLNALRKVFGYVPQEPTLFNTTLRENLLYGLPQDQLEVTDSEQVDARIWECLRLANADQFVRDLPSQLDTLVGEKGALLSGGQKQRVAIARALVKEPRILLLDEATSALDERSERLVHDALSRLPHTTTTLLITHRASAMRLAHRIVVLAPSGGVAEEGSWGELMARESGSLRRLLEERQSAPQHHLSHVPPPQQILTEATGAAAAVSSDIR